MQLHTLDAIVMPPHKFVMNSLMPAYLKLQMIINIGRQQTGCANTSNQYAGFPYQKMYVCDLT